MNATSHGRRAVMPGRPADAVHDLGGDEHDAERDHRLDRLLRHVHEAERRAQRASGCARRVNAVTVAISRRVAPTSMQQREHEQQVIDAEQDVLDAERDVGASRRRATPARRPTVNAGRRRREPRHLRRAVGARDAHEHVGDGRAEPGDR